MTKVIDKPLDLSMHGVWRELIRVFAETALFGEEITESDLDELLDPASSKSIKHETKLIGFSVELTSGLKGDADSLDVTEAIMAIEEAFDITIDEDALNDLENAGGVLELVWATLHPQDATT